MSLLDEGKIAPHIMGLASEAGQTRSIAVPDELIKPGGLLYITGGTVAGQCAAHKVKVLPCVKHILQRRNQFLWLVSDTAVQVDQQPIEIVVDLEVVAGRFVKENPASAAKDLDVTLIVDREQGNDEFSQCFLAADPGHEAVQGVSPPSSGRRVCAASGCSRKLFSPRMAAAMPLIRRVRWAMVERTSCSVAAK